MNSAAMHTSSHKQSTAEDYPYVMRLSGQRAIALTIPGNWVVIDKTGAVGFRPPAVRWLDKLRALYMRISQSPTPGFIRTLRQAMNLTQEQFALKVGVGKMSVYRWESGTMRPSGRVMKALTKLRAAALRRGLLVEAA
jgi:DNA-binding XRE family transcriptional regulator